MARYCMNCMAKMGDENTCSCCGAVQDDTYTPHQLRPGTILNARYLVGKVIGQGGFGITYIGRDLKLDMIVAIKEYYPNGYANRNVSASLDITITNKENCQFIEDGKNKFLSEARVLAKFSEESGVVDVRDYFEENKTAYIIMEYLEGQDLRSYLKTSTFLADEIFELINPVMIALEKIHNQGIIHRDISPDNLMLLKNGTLKLMDFGAARMIDYSDQKSVSVVLKSGYAPEEQYRPKGTQGPWTDVYALCATIYKCITGLTPDDALQRAYKDEIKWPSEMGVCITANQEKILKKGMSVKQEKRFQTIREMEQALYQLINEVPNIDIHTNIEEDDKTVYRKHISESDKNRTVLHEHDFEHKKEKGIIEKKRDNNGNDTKQKKVEKNKKIGNRKNKEKKLFPKKKLFIGVAVFLLVTCVGTVVGINIFKQNNKSVEKKTKNYNLEEMYHITLTSDDDVSVKEFNKDVEILKGRLGVFAGKSSYNIEVKEDQVDLYIDKKVFGDKTVADGLLCYISRPINLYLYEYDYKTYKTGEHEELKRKDIKKVALKEGTIDGLNAADYGVKTDSYKYVEITLKDEYAKEAKRKIETWKTNNIVIRQDLENNQGYFFPMTFSNDGKTINVLIDDVGKAFAETAVYNWSNEPLSAAFYYRIDVNNIATWEKVDKVKNPGNKQCNVDKVTGKTVTIKYDTYSDYTDSTWEEAEEVFRERLDSLNQPYALGTYEEEGKKSMIVKTGITHMGVPIMDLIKENNELSIMGSMSYRSLYNNTSNGFTYEKREDGTYEVQVQMEEYNVPDVERITKILENNGGGELSVAVDSVPFVSTYQDKIISDGKITFDHLVFSDRESITDDNVWMVKLLNQVWNGSELSLGFSIDAFIYNKDENGKSAKESDFGCSMSKYVNEIKRQIQEVDEDLRVEVTFNKEVLVYADLAVDETLPEETLQLFKNIVKKIDFKNSVFHQINFYFIKEDDVEKERDRIFLLKKYSYESADGQPYVHGIFSGGRLNRYKSVFERLVENDSIIKQYTGKYTNWDLGYEKNDVESNKLNINYNGKKMKNMYFSAAVGSESKKITFSVNDKEVNKFDLSESGYSNIFKIDTESKKQNTNKGLIQDYKVKMKQEGVGTLKIDAYTKDYEIISKEIMVSAYTIINKKNAIVKNDCSLYSMAKKDKVYVDGKLSKGTKVTIKGQCRKFYYVEMETGKRMYILKKSLKVKK